MPETQNTNPNNDPQEPTPEIVMIPTGDLYVPDWNPRKYVNEGELQKLITHRKNGGEVPPIFVWKGPGHAPWAIISGQRRWMADKRLGNTNIPSMILDITLEEAKDLAFASNEDSKPHWLDWVIGVENRYNDQPQKSQDKLGEQLGGLTGARVNYALKVAKALNPASRALIVKSLNDGGPEKAGNETAVLALANLLTPEQVEIALPVFLDHQMTVSQAKSLASHIKAGNPPETYTGHKVPKAPKAKKAPSLPPEAVEKLIGLGKHLGAAEARGEDTQPIQDQITAYRESLSPSSGISTPPGSQPASQSFKITSPEGFALLRQKTGDMVKAVFKKDTPKIESHIEKEAQKSLKWSEKLGKWFVKHAWHKFLKYEHRFCKAIAKWAVPEHYTHSGGKKASRGFLKDAATLALTLLHWAVYGFIQFAFGWIVLTWLASRFVPFLKPWVEWPFRWVAREVLAIPAGAWAWGLSHEFPAIVIAAVLFVLISMASKVEPMRMTLLGVLVAAVFYYGPRWAEGIPSGTETQASAQVEPTPVPQTTLSLGLGQPKHVGDSSSESAGYNRGPRQMASTQGHASQQAAVAASSQMKSWSEEQESKTDLEFEIAAVRANTRIKPFAFEPNYLDGAIAGQRLQDLADPDKYTMRRGHETDKVLGVSLLSTNLIIVYKSSDVFDGIAGGSSKASFYWEDVKTIHVNQLESSSAGGGANTIFQCGVIADGTKEPFTIQCGSEGDLKHLVSALEFWIKTAQGHYAPLTGMPYLNQGLVLNNDCVVDKLWADSPAWNAGSDMEPAQPNRVAQLGASQQVKAGVALGDHLWSIGKVTSERQSRNDLEAGLQSLPITLFAASPAEWEKALTAARAPGQSTGFRPKLRRVVLSL